MQGNDPMWEPAIVVSSEQQVSAHRDCSLDLRGWLRPKTQDKVKRKAQVAGDRLRRGSKRSHSGILIILERSGDISPAVMQLVGIKSYINI